VKVIILLNVRSWRNELENQRTIEIIRSAAVEAGLIAELWPVDPGLLTQEAANASRLNVDAVVAAGGDGTISAVAAALAGGDMPLGVLPRGTLNHFARDLGIPRELRAAARVVAAGRVRRVDVGEVNGRIFINNSSIGIYPAMVQERDAQRMRWRRKKWLAMAMAAMRVFRSPPLLHIRVKVGPDNYDLRTPLVLVGNNRYELSLPALGGRPTLTGGELSLHVAKRTARAGIVWLAVRGLVGRLRASRDFYVAYPTELVVDASRTRLAVAIDGEVIRLDPPLLFRIRPQHLAVLAGLPARP
jgi:diacylglycerol kinase family enzyme